MVEKTGEKAGNKKSNLGLWKSWKKKWHIKNGQKILNERKNLPEGTNLEERTAKIVDRETEKQFKILLYIIGILFLSAIFFVGGYEKYGNFWKGLLGMVEGRGCLLGILVVGIAVSWFLEKYGDNILAFILAVAIIIGIVALCVRLFGVVGGGIAGVLAVAILLKVLKIL